MNKLNTIDGETLMSRPLQPLNFVVDTLISRIEVFGDGLTMHWKI